MTVRRSTTRTLLGGHPLVQWSNHVAVRRQGAGVAYTLGLQIAASEHMKGRVKAERCQRLATKIDRVHKRPMADKRKKTISKTVALKLVTRDVPNLDDIAARAHQRFVERGGEHGHDVEDWLAAEAELRG
jgi:hypothetical protein